MPHASALCVNGSYGGWWSNSKALFLSSASQGRLGRPARFLWFEFCEVCPTGDDVVVIDVASEFVVVQDVLLVDYVPVGGARESEL